MVAPRDFQWSFRSVCAYRRDRIFFVAARDKDEEDDRGISFFFMWDGAWRSEPVPLIATDLCVTENGKPNLLLMGINGAVLRRAGGEFEPEIIDESEAGPQNIGDLREIRTIKGKAYVVGMGRTAYRCDGPQRWTQLDQGLREEEDGEDVGLNSIDGVSEQEIHAVGWGGEIWSFNGKRWSQLDSPTNLALYRVRYGMDGVIYACGQEGSLIHSDRDGWRSVEHGETEDDFWGMAWFKGRLYLSTLKGLYSYSNGRLTPVRIRSERRIVTTEGDSYCRLDSNNEVLWSLGKKMAMFSFDGLNWTETPYS